MAFPAILKSRIILYFDDNIGIQFLKWVFLIGFKDRSINDSYLFRNLMKCEAFILQRTESGEIDLYRCEIYNTRAHNRISEKNGNRNSNVHRLYITRLIAQVIKVIFQALPYCTNKLDVSYEIHVAVTEPVVMSPTRECFRNCLMENKPRYYPSGERNWIDTF